MNVASRQLLQVLRSWFGSSGRRLMADEGTRHRKKQPLSTAGGGRPLLDLRHVFQHNAWDNVQWGEEQVREAEEKLKKNSVTQLSEEQASKYEEEASDYWNAFYGAHENKFFKDRHWLFTECPELIASGEEPLQEPNVAPHEGPDIESNQALKQEKELHSSDEDCPGMSAAMRILEVGCGTGSTVFPLLEANKNRSCRFFVYCCDFSAKAIELVRSHADYDPARCHAFLHDVSVDADATLPFPEASLDMILLIFVLSAISPDRFAATIQRLAKCLKPGGRIFFRDYGRYDMAELRFKPGRCISEHFYVRGDGTRVYFFSQEELRDLFEGVGLVEEQNLVDRRLLVNRGRQLTMYRVWIQCKYRRPL